MSGLSDAVMLTGLPSGLITERIISVATKMALMRLNNYAFIRSVPMARLETILSFIHLRLRGCYRTELSKIGSRWIIFIVDSKGTTVWAVLTWKGAKRIVEIPAVLCGPY